MKKMFKNRYGLIRSGWIIIVCLILYYVSLYFAQILTFEATRKLLQITGNLDYTTGFRTPLADAIDGVMPVIMQMITEIATIALSLIIWKIMRYDRKEIGIGNFKKSFKSEGAIGLLLGFAGCTLIFLILLISKSVLIDPIEFVITPRVLLWLLTMILVGFAEELFCRGLFMSVLRRSNNKFLIIILPSLIFGGIHLFNPNVTVLSILNIILIGIVFSYMYYKSGNLWMCIGYHITWNIFQSVIYGMPVSGLNIDSIMTTQYPAANILNGGGFGIEGGILTTIVNILILMFAIFYYRSSTYEFLSDTHCKD